MHSLQPNKLTIDNLAFERNNQFLFREINFALQAGDLLQVRGANGSGKSTLLRMLAGFIEPQGGTILWQDKSICQHRDAYQQQLHYLGHHNGIKHSLTVYENLQLHAALMTNKPEPNHLKTAIKQVDLTHVSHTQAIHLSAGQLRRLGLARLLLHPIPLWILDEPTTALDADGQALLGHLLKQHLTNGGMAIIATHQTLAILHNTKTIYLGEQHV